MLAVTQMRTMHGHIVPDLNASQHKIHIEMELQRVGNHK